MNKEELEKAILDANNAYSAGLPFITDSEYDLLWQQLYSIDPSNSLLYHTAQNRYYVTDNTYHKYQIFGTNKAFNMLDLKPFLTRFGSQELIIEPKYDGCAAVMTKTQDYWQLTLEGDGKSGRNITHLIPYINFDHTEFKHFQTIEIIIPWKDWDESFGKNPRNAVAGWLARKYDKPPINMTAVAHNNGKTSKPYKYDGNLDAFGELLLSLYSEWSKLYPMDGVMIKVADEKARLISGNNGQVNNWSIAWKPPIQTKTTIVTSIEWNVSRLGRVVPTVIYNPIELCSTTNTRVTGNNAQWINDKQIMIGSEILVGKAGEIIPKILDVKNDNPYKLNLPTTCPKCKESLTLDGVHLVCNGSNCITKLATSIYYFYAFEGIKINGIGPKVAEDLLENQKIYEVLSTRPWALLDVVSYNIINEVYNVLGEATFLNILNEIHKANNTKTMANFITGLGLPGLGYRNSLRLCTYIKTGKINTRMPKDIINNFFNAVVLFNQAQKELKNFSFAPLPDTTKPLYCITGTLSQSRDAIIEIISKYNFEFSKTITKELSYLIVGQDPGKLKIEKAIRYNIPMLTEEQFFKFIKKES